MDLGGALPNWYKKKASARHAKEGIVKLIKHIEERESEDTDPDTLTSIGSEMEFYRGCLAQELPQPAEEQVVKCRITSRSKLHHPLTDPISPSVKTDNAAAGHDSHARNSRSQTNLFAAAAAEPDV